MLALLVYTLAALIEKLLEMSDWCTTDKLRIPFVAAIPVILITDPRRLIFRIDKLELIATCINTEKSHEAHTLATRLKDTELP
jgi:hypothetical protein